MGKGGLGGRRTKPRAQSPYPTNEPEPNDARHIEVGGSGTLTLFNDGQQFTGGFSKSSSGITLNPLRRELLATSKRLLHKAGSRSRAVGCRIK